MAWESGETAEIEIKSGAYACFGEVYTLQYIGNDLARPTFVWNYDGTVQTTTHEVMLNQVHELGYVINWTTTNADYHTIRWIRIQ